jgi:hypothetical protein
VCETLLESLGSQVPSALDQAIAVLPEGDQVKAQAVTKVALEIEQTVDRILRTQSQKAVAVLGQWRIRRCR